MSKIDQPSVQAAGQPTGQAKVYVEGTSKTIKLVLLLTGLATVIGAGMMVAGFLTIEDPRSSGAGLFVIGMLLFIVGGVSFIAMRIVRWWQHG
ncbi:MAG: hypothetical protein EA376_00890 [Phycisphaeraceae bacterium]|nr:MAG: hypothetical protein EA376_00890 [Phycisphaeraceae bacterium]